MVCLPPELTSDVTAKPKVEGLAQYSSSLDRTALSCHLCQIFSSQARRTKSFHVEPPHCREAAQQASETSFALLEGTHEIVLITPHSNLQGSIDTLHFKPRQEEQARTNHGLHM
ncbi:hypothetical protein WJX82_007635 [Trebouxia sp. C0006]